MWSIAVWSNVPRWIVAWSNVVRGLVKEVEHWGSKSSWSNGDLPSPGLVCCSLWSDIYRRPLNRFYESIVFVSFVVLHLLSSLTGADAAAGERRSTPDLVRHAPLENPFKAMHVATVEPSPRRATLWGQLFFRLYFPFVCPRKWSRLWNLLCPSDAAWSSVAFRFISSPMQSYPFQHHPSDTSFTWFMCMCAWNKICTCML